MVSCSVINCKNNSNINKKIDGITFHRFPRNKHRCKQWIVAVNRENKWSPSISSVVCSDHFKLDNFYVTENGLRRLSNDALPTINISPSQVPEQTISTSEIDTKSTDTLEVIELKEKVHRLEVLAENRKKRMYRLWLARNRMRKKLKTMRYLVKHLILFKRSLENRL